MVDEQGRTVFTDDISIRFEGENAIDVRQLFGYITGLETAYRENLNAEYHLPDMNLKVVAIEKGSFEILLQSAVALAPDLVTKLPTIITSFKEIMEMIKLKKELKGKKPESIDKENGKIVNCDGEVSYHNCTVINNYFNNPTIDAGLTSAFSALGRGTERRNAVNLTTAQETLRVEEEHYHELATPIVSNGIEDNKQIRVTDALLKICKLDFRGDTMWSFIDENEHKLSATIEDEYFIKRVRSGQIKLSANDVLKTRLRIEVTFNKFMDVDKKKYYIEKVYGTVNEDQSEQLIWTNSTVL